MRHSIRMKFFAASCAIAVAFVGILAVLNVTLYDNYYLWQRERALGRIYDTVYAAYHSNDGTLAEAIVNAEDTEGVRLSIVGRDGAVSYDSVVREQFKDIDGASQSLFYGLSIAEAALRAVDREQVKIQGSAFVNVSSKQQNEEFLCLVGSLEADGDYLVLRIPFTYMKQNSAFNTIFLLISGGVTLLLCTLLAFLIAQHFTGPLIAMNDVANTMADLDFSKKYEGPVNDEVGQLGQSINRLSEHLEQAIVELRQSNDQLACEIREKEKIDERRREFLINVSHELKTPIALIQGYAEGLREGIAETREDRDYYCTTITDEAARMNRLVMQLLSLSKLELGREQPTMSDIELDELLADAAAKTALFAAAKGLTVERIGSGLTIRSDFGLLEQVVSNYLTNAIRYTPEGGHIRLSAARDADGVTLTVMNEGEGVSEEELPRLWEKFYRTDKARSRESGGTGVGLSIVKATADLLGGVCGARNVPGGMEFWFSVREEE